MAEFDHEDGPHGQVAVPAPLMSGAGRAVLRALPNSRAVGGCVRDALAGRPIADIDVGVPLPPEEAVRLLRAAGLKVVETGLAHGTVTAILTGEPVEVTSLRRDVATDGRHAEVEWTTSWREDAARRDFTINAMSLDAEGRLWDWFGGRADLAAGVVRFVGEPRQRLREDYLRALRFFRFQARYGTGTPDPGALAAIRDAAGELHRLSAERVWSELKRLLAAPDPTGALQLMAETGVLRAVLPEADPALLPGLGRAIAAGMPADPVLRLAALLPRGDAGGAAQGTGREIADRLRFSNEERSNLEALEKLIRREDFGGSPGLLDDAAFRRWLVTRGDPLLPVGEAWLTQAREGHDASALRARIAATPFPVFPLLGRDAVAAGVRPGPALGRLLGEVRAWWLAGGCTADAEACRAELRRRVTDDSAR
ncbi:CCA tRNA nucleotidyltransferase [Roseomonas elaeocarpi]|uniref:CCA tRNA nucleotidyltransferase n=1 Tax=Roseomonas elaeocarpi TaxID=907779 RepID=A0ABV6JV69_9PROT